MREERWKANQIKFESRRLFCIIFFCCMTPLFAAAVSDAIKLHFFYGLAIWARGDIVRSREGSSENCLQLISIQKMLFNSRRWFTASANDDDEESSQLKAEVNGGSEKEMHR